MAYVPHRIFVMTLPGRRTRPPLSRPALSGPPLSGPALSGTLVATLVALAACTVGTEGPEGDRLISDAPDLTLVEDLRIGSFDDPVAGFSRIGDVDVDRDGYIFVAEAQDAEIRVYDPEGRAVRRFGRRGEGPGEFERMGSMGVTGDTVWVIEGIAGRVTLFDREGRVLQARTASSIPIPVQGCSGYVSPQGLLPDGTLWSWMSSILCRPDDVENGVGPNDSVPVPRVTFSPTGEVLDTVGWDPIPPPSMWTPPGFEQPERPPRVQIDGERFTVPSPPPPRRLHWIGLPDGKLVTDLHLPTTPEISTFLAARLDLDGDTVWARRLRYRPAGFAEAELDALAEEAASSPGGGFIRFDGGVAVQPAEPDADLAARARTRIRAEMDFPEFRLPVGVVSATSDGSMWLPLEGQTEAGSHAFLLLNPDGSTRGRLTLPERARVRWRSGDTILVVEPDDFDVPWLVRYRLEG